MGGAAQERKLTVTELLQAGAASYIARYPQQAVPQVQSTLAKLSLCRTAALEGRRYRCGNCASECVVYNSCGDRHCPTCSGAKRRDWLDSASGLILDGVDHFQVVFTLPGELSRIALGNRRAIYDLLFASAWTALRQTICDEQGYDPAALMVLHTWNQKLDAHAHVHAVVPGGGPALEGGGWKTARRGDDVDSAGCYLVDADQLRKAYRIAFLAGLDRLHEAGGLRLEGEFARLRPADAWRGFINKLQSTSWVCYIQPPPRSPAGGDRCGAGHVLKYLARYLTGGPISGSRIVSADEHEVTFLAREGANAGGDTRQTPVTISTTEFTRRWSLHVLPKGYTRTRRFGGWSNPRRSAYLAQCRQQLATSEASPSPDEVSGDTCQACPKCGGAMILQRAANKPSWHQVMHSSARPSWYENPSGNQTLPPATIRA